MRGSVLERETGGGFWDVLRLRDGRGWGIGSTGAGFMSIEVVRERGGVGARDAGAVVGVPGRVVTNDTGVP